MKSLILSGVAFIKEDFNEIIVPSIWDFSTFKEKSGEELSEQIWRFTNKSNKDCCLIPEVTGILQEMFRDKWWFKYKKKTMNVFYINRCYRYDKPQEGRYREFTQFGIEILGGDKDKSEYSKSLLVKVLNKLDIEYRFCDAVKRGLGYYTKDGFEAECDNLGAQKQIAGGGSYTEGCGWAVGVDRVVLTKMKNDQNKDY